MFGWVGMIPSVVSCCILVAVSAADQDCGTVIPGGLIGPGNYSGVGQTCAEARAALHSAMMGPTRDCAGCPQGQVGCHGNNVPDDPGGNIVEGACIQDPVTGLWLVAATVAAPTPFDSVCSSCKGTGGGGGF